MERDIRQSAEYQHAETYFHSTLGPAFGKISSAADPAPSPDGRTIAFTGGRLRGLFGQPETRICLAGADGQSFQEISSGPNDDRSPRWSPNGMHLAFLSDRSHKGMHQLLLLSRERLGDAQATPWIEGMAEYLHWSPDSERILVGVAGPGADIGDALGAGTITTRADQLPSWMPQVDSGATENKWRRIWLYDLASGSSLQLSPAGLNVWEAAWAGNERVAAIVSPAPGEGAWYTAQLVTINAGTGESERVYESRRQLGVPAASPSGAHIAVIEALCSDRGMVAGDLLVFSGTTGIPQRIDCLGVDVTQLAWRDERHLFFCGLRRLETVFGEVDLQNGAVQQLWATDETTQGINPHAAPYGTDGFVAVMESYLRPQELVLVRGGIQTPLFSVAHEGTRFACEVGGSLEAITWRSTDGVEIDGFLARPAGTAPFPLVVHIHGGPVWAYRNSWMQYLDLTRVLVDKGYAVLHPNPRGSIGRGQDFIEQVLGDMGGADADDILTGVDFLTANGIADAERIGTMGVSYGGFMSSWLITRTNHFAAAISMSPVNEWRSMHYTTYFPDFDRIFLKDVPENAGGEYDARSPLMFAERVATPTLHITGRLDEATPPSQAVAFHKALLEKGVISVLVAYPEEGHDVHRFPAIVDRCARVLAWFGRFMPV